MIKKLSAILAADHLAFKEKGGGMRKSVYVLGFIIATGLMGCATTKGPALTPLEIQQIQSRSFEAGKEVAFRSVVSVFQDLGYIIKSADLATGFITAESAASSNQAMKFWIGITRVDQTAVTAFIEEMGDKSLVRLNFVNRVETSSGYGQRDKQETPIYEPEAYQAAFEKIENAIFVRQAMQ